MAVAGTRRIGDGASGRQPRDEREEPRRAPERRGRPAGAARGVGRADRVGHRGAIVRAARAPRGGHQGALDRQWLDFEAVARRLHPTPALGVYPRNEEGRGVARVLDPRGERKRFGAPFGLRWPTGSGRAVVAIRNLQYRDGQLEIWAGCGVVSAERYEDEWQEVLDKMQAVRALWGV